MFESVGSSNNPSAVRRSAFLIVAIAFHLGLIFWLYRAATAVAEQPDKGPVKVVFHAPPPPPPPPPPPASHHTTHHKKHKVVHKTHKLVVPHEIPKEQPKADDNSDNEDQGVEGGVAGGVVGGVVGGVLGGQLGGQLGGTGTGEPPPVFLAPGMTPPKEVDPEACQPRYPKQAQMAGIHGMVIAEYTVTRSGQATNITIKRSTNPVFEGAVRRALRHCQFKPALNKGQPISVIVIRNYRFQQTQ